MIQVFVLFSFGSSCQQEKSNYLTFSKTAISRYLTLKKTHFPAR